MIFKGRNITDIDNFMTPTEDDLLPYENLCNIEKAKDSVLKGLDNKKRFTIFADVDTDGCTSGAIMYRYLRKFTSNVDWIINEGKIHGLKGQDVNRIETDVLIIVDSLDPESEKYTTLHNKGIEVIILDHHSIPQKNEVSQYAILVSSNYKYKNKALSGAGVTWKFCKYLDTFLLSSVADDLVDLATCGLIADMSDMSQDSMENRYICSLGFQNQKNIAIKEINGSFPFDSQAISFGISPLVNSACRVRQNELAMKLFITDNEQEVKDIIRQLKMFKQQQNDVINEIFDEIKQQADKQLNQKTIYVFIDTDLDITGLIGNKLLSIYQRPIFILRDKIDVNKDKEVVFHKYCGSMRAIGIENFRSLINSSGLCKADGHELASGFEIDVKNFEDFKVWLENELADIEFKTKYDIDICLDINDVNQNLIENIKNINKITGEGFKPIKVMVAGVTDYDISNMSKGKHLKIITDGMIFIKWNFNGNWEELGDGSLMNSPIQFIGTLNSGFIGRTFYLQMLIDDYEVI